VYYTSVLIEPPYLHSLFFHHSSSTLISTLSIHDALPIFYRHSARVDQVYGLVQLMDDARHAPPKIGRHPPILFLYGGNDQVIPRSEEHTYELQSPYDIVCRLLLEKKKKKKK